MLKRLFGLALMLILSFSTLQAQSGVRAVVVNEFANIRIVPAIGAEVLATVPAGYLFEFIDARSADFEWLRVRFNGDEGWVNVAPLTILEGDANALPVRDPRTIPYGGFEAPRAGRSDATSAVIGRLPNTGVRLRAGPSTGYPILANPLRFSQFFVTGRTASNAWVQIQFEGTLGWIAARYVEFQDGTSILDVPVDGIVAIEPPIAEPIDEDFIATLHLLLARVDLAQPSLDTIRTFWTDAALTGRASCRPYPAQPSAYNIPQPLLAAYFPRLNPLSELFNDAMFNVREAIQLYIEVCERPGIQNPVGQATVIGALEIIALADQQFAELRARLNVLIPPDIEPGADECLFVFNAQGAILKNIPFDTVVIGEITQEERITGFCFDAVEGQNVFVELLQRDTSNVVPLIALSPFDNPTRFLSVQRGAAANPYLSLGPLFIPQTGRYLLIVDDLAENREEPPQGEFGILLTVVPATFTTVGQRILNYDSVNGLFFTIPPNFFGTTTTQPMPVFGATVTPSGPPFNTSGVNNEAATPVPETSATCPGISFSCEQLASCEQAQVCLDAGNFSLDPDNDGVPCEVTRCPATGP